MTLDAILDQLQTEGVDPLPSRTSVQNIVRDWEKVADNVKLREFPFRWHRLEDAEVPWEASNWLLRCLEEHYAGDLETVAWARSMARAEFGDTVDMRMVLVGSGRFSNRSAKWCWRLHLAAPDLPAMDILTLAVLYSTEELKHDLLDEPIHDQGIDDWLALRPDLEQRAAVAGAWQRYWDAVALGLVKEAIPKTPEAAVERSMRVLSGTLRVRRLGYPSGGDPPGAPSPVGLWSVLTGTSEQLRRELRAMDQSEKEAHHERTPRTAG